jgi:myo-inositol-hexaphosphate 3-phosphohydrolase
LSVLLAVVIAMGFAAPAGAAVQPVGDATATVETVPVLSTGDAADDPAVWVHPSDPARSVVIGNDKGGALEVYDLSGARIQRIADGFFGNVDVRRSVPVGSGAVDVAVCCVERDRAMCRCEGSAGHMACASSVSALSRRS